MPPRITIRQNRGPTKPYSSLLGNILPLASGHGWHHFLSVVFCCFLGTHSNCGQAPGEALIWALIQLLLKIIWCLQMTFQADANSSGLPDLVVQRFTDDVQEPLCLSPEREREMWRAGVQRKNERRMGREGESEILKQIHEERAHLRPYNILLH